MPAVSSHLKKQFCHGYFEGCARFTVYQALGSGTVPQDLFPYDSTRAAELIAKGRPQEEKS